MLVVCSFICSSASFILFSERFPSSSTKKTYSHALSFEGRDSIFVMLIFFSLSGKRESSSAPGLFFKAKKQDVQEDLKQKKELVSLRLTTLDKQEKEISGTVEDLRKKVLKKVQK